MFWELLYVYNTYLDDIIINQKTIQSINWFSSWILNKPPVALSQQWLNLWKKIIEFSFWLCIDNLNFRKELMFFLNSSLTLLNVLERTESKKELHDVKSHVRMDIEKSIVFCIQSSLDFLEWVLYLCFSNSIFSFHSLLVARWIFSAFTMLFLWCLMFSVLCLGMLTMECFQTKLVLISVRLSLPVEISDVCKELMTIYVWCMFLRLLLVSTPCVWCCSQALRNVYCSHLRPAPTWAPVTPYLRHHCPQ